MGSFEEILVKKHLKRTKARVMILKVLEKSLPLTAGEVYEAVRGKDMRLSCPPCTETVKLLLKTAYCFVPPCWLMA